MNTKHTAFNEKQLGHAPKEYGYAEAVAWAIGYNAALERTAAPDLLEALMEMLPGAEAMGWSTEKARAAIAKATGQSL